MLVHLALVELEGVTIIEAMSCANPSIVADSPTSATISGFANAIAKPIIVADSPTSASSSFVKSNGYVFDPNNADELKEKIISLLNDKEKLKMFGESSLRQAKKLSFEASLKKMDDVFLQAIRDSNETL